jgi:hypothetical protein
VSRRLLAAPLVLAWLLIAPALPAQNRTDGLIAVARAHINAREFDRADTSLSNALDAASYLMDTVHVYVWRAILGRLRGSDSQARASFHAALVLYPLLKVNGLDQLSPGLNDIFEAELRRARVYPGNQLDEQPGWTSGPTLVYPADMRRRHVSGQATVMIAVDTTGHLEPQSLQVIEVPDSAFVEPLREMLLAATFTPGRIKGHAVRSRLNLTFTLEPPAPKNPMALIGGAREQLHAHHPDSALALTAEALDSANQATPGMRVYALLVRGLAFQADQRDSEATVAFDAGLAAYHELTAHGVDLAPFLKQLADSIRAGRRRPLTASRVSSHDH